MLTVRIYVSEHNHSNVVLYSLKVPDVSDAQLESPAQRPGPSSVPEIPTCPNAAVRKVLDDLNAGDITGTGGSDGYDAQEALNVYDPEEATEVTFLDAFNLHLKLAPRTL